MIKKIKLAIFVILLSVCCPVLWAADLTFANLEFDLGRMMEGELKSAYFYFSNDNNKDIEILNVKTSCYCTVAGLEKFNAQTEQYDGEFENQEISTSQKKYVIPAHSKGRVNAVYDSFEHPGRFSKTITIYTATDTIRVRLKGEVLPLEG